MERTISVKGTGHVSLKPDQTVVTMMLRTVDQNYDISVNQSNELLNRLREALIGIGFGEDDLKTTSFNVSSEYENIRDREGNYRNVFRGYAVVHGLKLEFDFDPAMLSRVLTAVSGCVADPDLSVQFTVKDKNAVSEALLKDSARNARQTAEILAEASGAALGQLLSIEYNWGEQHIYSRTEYRMEAKCMAMGTSDGLRFTPDDIELNDTAAFVWELLTKNG